MNPKCPFLLGIARAMWVSSWASRQEERGKRLQGELMDQAPDTPMRHKLEAARFIGKLEAANGRHHACVIADAWEADNGTDRDDSRWVDDTEFQRLLGHYLAMRAMGTGVSWFDDHARFEIKIPDIEVSY